MTVPLAFLPHRPGQRLALWLACGLVALAGLLSLVFCSPERNRDPIRGIDVSHHQGDIDWTRVAGDNVTFAYLKATEGGDYVDAAFAHNLRGATEAGIAVGAYHFFTFCRPTLDQAKNFMAQVPADRMLLPPAVDIEFGGNCPRRPPPDELRNEITAFLQAIETHYGREAVIYIIGDAEKLYAAALPKRKRWVRSLGRHPGDHEWALWQYHSRGRVEGIAGDVDLNILNPAEAKWLDGND